MNSVRLTLGCFVLSVSAAVALGQAGFGVTAAGKIVTSTYGQKSPWMDDVVKMVRPDYPYEERARHHQGSGRFRVIVDAKTGSVTDVTVTKSTGYTTLDDAVVSAFQQCRLKPGKWKRLEFPVTFTLARTRAEAIEKSRQLEIGTQH